MLDWLSGCSQLGARCCGTHLLARPILHVRMPPEHLTLPAPFACVPWLAVAAKAKQMHVAGTLGKLTIPELKVGHPLDVVGCRSQIVIAMPWARPHGAEVSAASRWHAGTAGLCIACDTHLPLTSSAKAPF